MRKRDGGNGGGEREGWIGREKRGKWNIEVEVKIERGREEEYSAVLTDIPPFIQIYIIMTKWYWQY